jgi:hypothetical protein
MANSDLQPLNIEEECERLKLMGINCDVCTALSNRKDKKHENYKRWLKYVISILLGFVAFYIVLHIVSPGAENAMMGPNDVKVVGDLLDAEKHVVDRRNSTLILDTMLVDSQTANGTVKVDSYYYKTPTPVVLDSAYRMMIIDYVFTQYPPQAGSIDLAGLELDTAAEPGETEESHERKIIGQLLEAYTTDKKNSAIVRMIWLLSSEDLKKALPEVPIATTSYFWLAGNNRYWEVIFWSIFGVLASLLYSGTEFMRKGTFKQKEVYVQVAKFFYTPLCALIVVAAYEYITIDDEISNLSAYASTTGLIVISFILGFFSGSTISLLQKIKEMIFPSTKTDVEDTQVDDDDHLDDDSIEQIIAAVNTSVDDLKNRPSATTSDGNDPDEIGYELASELATPDPSEGDNSASAAETNSTTEADPAPVAQDPDETGYEDPDETGYEDPNETNPGESVG